MEVYRPTISADTISKVLQAEILRCSQYEKIINRDTGLRTQGLILMMDYMEAYLQQIEVKAHIRTKWPDKLNRFPFNLSYKLQRSTLKIANLLFKDQREINLSLVGAFKESIAINRRLVSQLEEVRLQLDQQANALNIANEEIEILKTSRHIEPS